MQLDLVHDMQIVYRKVLNCMARPGLIENIDLEAKKINTEHDLFKATLIMMYLLLDTETSYKIVTNKEEAITRIVNQHTYARAQNVEEADYLFILGDSSPFELENAISKSKIGDLVDPHKSATILIEVERIKQRGNLTLIGPGIEKENYAEIQVVGDWMHERKKKNIEYPLGIDMVFIDQNSNIMCLPRTTQVIKSGVK